GLGWAMGYAGGLICLVIVLAFFSASPDTGKTMLGFLPWFGLDPETYEGARATGPFTAIWYILFVIPLFLLTPDTARNFDIPNFGAALRSGVADLRETFANLKNYGNVVRYLVSRMIYADGLVALFAFGGIYGASVFGWSITELGIFGILLTIAGLIGALVGGRLDDSLGPKIIIQISLVILALGSLGILSIDKDTIFFIIPVAHEAGAGGGAFSTLPEQVYLALGAVIGFAAGPVQAASRTLLIRVAPPEKLTQFFGLFALTGKVTSFIGPTLVGIVTAVSGSQRIGISILLVFFAIGFVGLFGVRVPAAK
ncbi:MAG: MFS transporter, partial [Rhizobiales bacterium]|nr:MFS transporter [Hyphomicrobiales bacterium]